MRASVGRLAKGKGKPGCMTLLLPRFLHCRTGKPRYAISLKQAELFCHEQNMACAALHLALVGIMIKIMFVIVSKRSIQDSLNNPTFVHCSILTSRQCNHIA